MRIHTMTILRGELCEHWAYGDAIMHDLFQKLKSIPRIGQGWSRFTYGGSTAVGNAGRANVYPDEIKAASRHVLSIDFRAYAWSISTKTERVLL